MRPRIITPATAVITLDRAKLQCKLDGDARNEEVTDAIESARAYVEAYIGQPIGEQVLEYTYTDWAGSVVLPCDVTELLAVSAAGVPVLPLPALTGRTLTLSATAPVVVRIKCGFTSVNVPGPVKSSMLLMIGDLIVNQQGQTDTQLYQNAAFENMLWPWRERLAL